jgi:hypothetical protein
MKLRDINAYVLQNPDALEALFVEIFGKYLMRYYDKSGEYSVSFDRHADTSYMNSGSKQIVIALKNIILLLKANVHVLAVAYHELAHVLYTSDRARDQMRKKAGNLLLSSGIVADHRVMHYNNVDQQIHGIWNLLEDQRIERLMVSEFPFLNDIIEPLKSALTDDDKLFTWRRGKYSQRSANVPQEIVDLCEKYAGQKRFKTPTIELGSAILARLYEILFGKQLAVNQTQTQDYTEIKYQPMQDDQQAQSAGQPTPTDEHGDDDDADDDQQGEQPSNDSDDTDDDADDIDENDDDNASGEDELDDEDDADDEDGDVAEQPKDAKPSPTQQQLDQRERDLAKAQAQDEQEQGILHMLKDIQQTQRENEELQRYKDSVIEDHTPLDRQLPKQYEIPAIFSIAQDVRNGMTAAQRKSFTSNISNRVNVSRIVEALASKQEPKVFAGKGKDMTQLRKVVIFEDISGSTHGTLSNIFSQIGYALAKSFSTSEWWLYGSKLAKKHLRDYKYMSAAVGCDFYSVGQSTSSRSLLNVMKKYKEEKAIYVVITDGDINQLIQDDLFKKHFNDSTAVVGVLEDDAKLHAKHVVNFREEYINAEKNKSQTLNEYENSIPNDVEDKWSMIRKRSQQLDKEVERQFLSIINKSLQEVVAVVKGRLK